MRQVRRFAIIFLALCGLSTIDVQASTYSDQMEKIARLVVAEAEGEEDLGKKLVADVIFNRLTSQEFPNTLDEVLYQPGQFSSMHNGRFERVEADAHTISLVRQELYYRTDYDVLFFNTAWIPGTKHITEVGHHKFSTLE